MKTNGDALDAGIAFIRVRSRSVLMPFPAVRVKLDNKRYALQHQERCVTLEGWTPSGVTDRSIEI
jgi:hypothetical protein